MDARERAYGDIRTTLACNEIAPKRCVPAT